MMAKLDTRVLLKVAQSCYRHLSWELEPQSPREARALADRLVARGYTNESRFDWVRELVHPEGHHVIVVPRTGRIQIRVHYLTPFEARQPSAARIALELAELLEAR